MLITRSTGGYSATSHLWTTAPITAGQDAYKFFVEGFRSFNPGGDDFVFRYATAAKGPYQELLTLNLDFDNTLSVAMDSSVGGKTLYILVEDVDRTFNETSLESVKIDYMYVNGYKVNPIAYFPSNPGVATNSIRVADIDKDGRADIVAGLNTSTPAGRIHVYWNLGTGTSYTSPDVLNTPARVNEIDIGYLSGNVGSLVPDNRLDIAVGMANNQIQALNWNGVRNSWSAATLFTISAGTTAFHLRVGDVDGDGWDDILIATSILNIYLLKNNNRVGTGFEATLVDDIGGGSGGNAISIKDLDLGDVARGVMATYATI